MVITFSLLAVILILLIVIVLLYSRNVILNRIDRGLRKGVAKERSATTEMLRSTREFIAHPERENDVMPSFIKFVVRTLRVQGGAILLCGDDGYLYGCVVSGTFPPLKESSADTEAKLLADDVKHTEFIKGYKTRLTAAELDKACSGQGFAFYSDEAPLWFSPEFAKVAPRSLLVPIKFRNSLYGCIVVADKKAENRQGLVHSDGYFLVRMAEMVSMELEVIKAARFRHEYEQQLQAAREEGMTQVSTGIIHNIGNAVTIAKLTAGSLREKMNWAGEDRPEKLILHDMLPIMEKHLLEGTLQDFLQNDKGGRQYLSMIRDLMKCQEQNAHEGLTMINSIAAKLHHISEIIELQQRFMGELGTENMVQLANVLDASVVIFEESFNKRNVSIKKDINRDLPEILVDSSIVMQVFINIFKNAIEAMSEENSAGKQYELFLSVKKDLREGKTFAVTTIRDNGPGIPEDLWNKVFEFGFSTKKNDGTAARGVGLHFCLNSVSKYGGRIELDSEPGKKTEFRILLPLPERAKEGGGKK